MLATTPTKITRSGSKSSKSCALCFNTLPQPQLSLPLFIWDSGMYFIILFMALFIGIMSLTIYLLQSPNALAGDAPAIDTSTSRGSEYGWIGLSMFVFLIVLLIGKFVLVVDGSSSATKTSPCSPCSFLPDFLDLTGKTTKTFTIMLRRIIGT